MEALLTTQMVCIHLVMADAMGRMMQATRRNHRDAEAAIFNNCTRTFAAQLELLKRYRSIGRQSGTVQHQHVTLNEGGQAVVAGGNLPSRAEREKSLGQPHSPSGTPGIRAPLQRDLETLPPALPGTSGARQGGVPLARRERRRT